MYLLLVDHNFINSSELQEIISQAPVEREIVNCYSQETLLKIAGKISPDLIIIDFDLLKGDQPSFFKTLYGKKMAAHVMVLINPGHYEELYSAIELGFIDDFMVKPFQIQEFLARVKLATLREKQTGEKEELPLWLEGQERKESKRTTQEEPGESLYLTPEVDLESKMLDETIDKEVNSLESGFDYENVDRFQDSGLTGKDYIKTDESDLEEQADWKSVFEKEPGKLFDEPVIGEEDPQASVFFEDKPIQDEIKTKEDQDQEDLLTLFDDVDSIFNSKPGPEDEIITPDRGTGIFEKAELETEHLETTEELKQSGFESLSDFELEPGMASPTDALFNEPTKPDHSEPTAPLPKENQLFDDLFEGDRIEGLKEEPEKSFFDSDYGFDSQSSFEDNDFMDLPSGLDDEALFSPETEDKAEKDFSKQDPGVTAEEIRKHSALPGKSAHDYLFGEDGDKEPDPDLPDWIDEQFEYDWRRDLEKKEEMREEFREQDQEDLYQERDLSRRKRKSRSSHKRFFYVFGNILFVFLLLFMAGLSFLLIQSRIAGGVPQVAGYQMYIVLSGSMNPEFDTGSLAFVRDIEPLELIEGDIITFESPNNLSSLTTHRIVEIKREDGLKFITRGDANNVNDPSPVPAENVVGIVTGTVPYVGYVLNFAQTTQGLVLLIFIPGILIILFELSKIVRYLSQGERRSRRNRDSDYKPQVEGKR